MAEHLPVPQHPTNGFTVDQAISAWLNAKHGRSGSVRTLATYKQTVADFRAALSAFDLDLFGDPTRVGLVAQGWAATRSPGSWRDNEVAPAMYNQRLAVLSSFYAYARKARMYHGDNPIDFVERRKVEEYGGAKAMDSDEVKRVLDEIERDTLAGKRDYALLSVTLYTGRRASEIRAMCWRDLQVKQTKRGELVHVRFPRLKGNESDENELEQGTSAALLDYLYTLYGPRLASLPHDAPIWVALSHNGYKGAQLSIKALERICLKRCGSGRFHLLRHSFAVNMRAAGADASEIQKKLKHRSLATTGRYLAHFDSPANKHGKQLELLYGISVDDE
jgi:integrase